MLRGWQDGRASQSHWSRNRYLEVADWQTEWGPRENTKQRRRNRGIHRSPLHDDSRHRHGTNRGTAQHLPRRTARSGQTGAQRIRSWNREGRGTSRARVERLESPPVRLNADTAAESPRVLRPAAFFFLLQQRRIVAAPINSRA